MAEIAFTFDGYDCYKEDAIGSAAYMYKAWKNGILYRAKIDKNPPCSPNENKPDRLQDCWDLVQFRMNMYNSLRQMDAGERRIAWAELVALKKQASGQDEACGVIEFVPFIQGAVRFQQYQFDICQSDDREYQPKLQWMKNAFLEAARSLARIHDAQVYHMDIKPENIVFTMDASGRVHATIIDFDSSWFQGHCMFNIKGTDGFWAPELYHTLECLNIIRKAIIEYIEFGKSVDWRMKQMSEETISLLFSDLIPERLLMEVLIELQEGLQRNSGCADEEGPGFQTASKEEELEHKIKTALFDFRNVRMSIGPHTDIYSLGATFESMLTVFIKNGRQERRELNSPDFHEDNLKKLIQAMKSYDPAQRPGINAVIRTLQTGRYDSAEQQNDFIWPEHEGLFEINPEQRRHLRWISPEVFNGEKGYTVLDMWKKIYHCSLRDMTEKKFFLPKGQKTTT